MPRENILRTTFSCTTQWSPTAFTRRVRPASPGGRRVQPSGGVRTVPSAALTVLGVGPGVKVRSFMTFPNRFIPPTDVPDLPDYFFNAPSRNSNNAFVGPTPG